LLRGKIRFELKKLEAAYQDLLQAANISKSNPEVYLMLSKVCQRMGDDKKAKHYSNIA
jgi:predicted Zn-dependent protease